MINIIENDKNTLVYHLWKSDEKIRDILDSANSLDEARDSILDYLNILERTHYDMNNPNGLHIIERKSAEECIGILKNIIRRESEILTNFSALDILIKIAKGEHQVLHNVDKGFLCEFIYLFKGLHGKTGIPSDKIRFSSSNEKTASIRSKELDCYANSMREHLNKYNVGTEKSETDRRLKTKKKILEYFGATESDWNDYHWHLKHIIKDLDTLSSLITLEEDEWEGLSMAEKHNIPFHITPYYLSLFNLDGRNNLDRTVRAQVIPSTTYCKNMIKSREEGVDMDFMCEKSTRPHDGITRRYPMIVIIKPFKACPQICIYCQRNWEMKKDDDASSHRDQIEHAIDWIKNNENIIEVLVTGGDPLMLKNPRLDKTLSKISSIDHVERIRIGTRMPVTLPFRIDDELIEMLSKYHELGKREICIVVHFEHTSEITWDVIEAVKKIKSLGINVYNQQVFTYFNSFKYESSALRIALKRAGIDPYYNFNTKGKQETIDFRVPIARIEQERKEEARFLPGLIRTDETIFNVPKLGKSHLRSAQDHEIVMILGTGQRVHRFYPWESKVALVDDYLYTDVSIYDYLLRLKNDGEDLKEYNTIWYYH